MSRKNTPLVVIATFSFLAISLSFLAFTGPSIPLFLAALFFILLAAFFQPFWSLLALIFLRPLLDVFSQKEVLKIGELSLTATSLLGISAILVFFLTILSKKKRFWEDFPPPLFLPWALFFGGILFSLFSSISYSASLAETIRLFSIFSIFFLGWFLIDSSTKLKKFILLAIASSVLPLLVGFWQFFTQTGFQLSFEDIPNRIFGTFAHPNPFAYFLVLITVLLTLKIREESKSPKKLLGSVYFALVITAIFLTYTRGAWLTLVFALAILALFYSRFLLFLGGALFALIYLLFAPVQNRVNALFYQSSSNSVNWRMEMWLDGVDIAKKNPLNGTGIGTSQTALSKIRGPYMGSLEPHNDFLKTAIEGGLFLAFGYFFLFANLLIRFWKNFRQKRFSSQVKFINLSFFAITFSLLIASFFDNILSATALQWLFWSLSGAVLKNSK